MADNRVLIIDDDRLMRNSVVDLMEAAGWVTKALARATDAARWIDQFQPDVILSDVRMPEMSGLEVLQWLREYETDNDLPKTPFMMVTSRGDKSHRDCQTRSLAQGTVKKITVSAWL